MANNNHRSSLSASTHLHVPGSSQRSASPVRSTHSQPHVSRSLSLSALFQTNFLGALRQTKPCAVPKPLAVSLLPPEGVDASIVEGFAGDGAILIQGQVVLKHTYKHPITITARNLKLTFRGEIYIKRGTDKLKSTSFTSLLIEEKLHIVSSISDLPVKISPNSETTLPFFMPLKDTDTKNLPATTTAIQRPNVALVRYAVIATVWDIDIDPEICIESKPLVCIIERHFPNLLETMSLYPSRIYEFTGESEMTKFIIKVPKIIIPNGRMEFTYWFQSKVGNPSTPNTHPPHQIKLSVVEEVFIHPKGTPSAESITFKKRIRPAILESDRLLLKGWIEPAKVGIRLPIWSGLKDPESIASHLKLFRPDDPMNKILEYINGTYSTAYGLPPEQCIHLQINHYIELSITFLNSSRSFTEKVKVFILPARKPSLLAAMFDGMFRSYGGVGATYADLPPPEVDVDLNEYESIINAIADEDPPPEFEEVGTSQSSPSINPGGLPARIACQELSPSYTLQTLAANLASRVGDFRRRDVEGN